MIPYVYAVDDFFPPYEFDLLRDYALQLEYKDVEAPFDGVTYKNIGLPVPDGAIQRMAMQLTWIMGYRVDLKHTAFRLSLEGSLPPQWAHSDAEVAQYGFFLHLNPAQGGTALLEHIETGMRFHPHNSEQLEAWQRDHNLPPAWNQIAKIDAAPNRAVILRADVMHGALPIYGYGQTPADGRLILLSFFD
jgi:hypothetical protein